MLRTASLGPFRRTQPLIEGTNRRLAGQALVPHAPTWRQPFRVALF